LLVLACGTEPNAGAVTFASGTVGIIGVVSAVNALVDSTRNDCVGANVISLSNGNYVVSSQNWNNGAIVDAGASTWGSGISGISGLIAETNFFVGMRTSD